MLMRSLPLPPPEGGHLVVIDDLTRQMQAEREATWEEASRRFAHEIKNPLTPIQLAASEWGKNWPENCKAKTTKHCGAGFSRL